jgi:hypothetical protein
MNLTEFIKQNHIKCAMAARLMSYCLSIEAEPAFYMANPHGAGTPRARAEPYGIGLFKDAHDFSIDGEKVELQLLVTDENGLVKAVSKRWFPLDRALDLLARLPLEVAPRAAQWLKDALDEIGTVASEAVACRAASAGAQIQKEVGKQC